MLDRLLWLVLGQRLPLLGLVGLLVSLCLLLAVVRLIFVVVTVKFNSMSPALRPGDRVLVLRHWRTGWLRKGHIVLFQGERSVTGTQSRNIKVRGAAPLIKRVVGLPGDVFSVSTLDGSGPPSQERSSGGTRCESTFVLRSGKQDRTMRVPSGHFFVCGDNPQESTDSRSWGPVPAQRLVGLVILRLASEAKGEHMVGDRPL